MSRHMRLALACLPWSGGSACRPMTSPAPPPRRVILTRAQRVDGSPTELSRWLLRLDAVIQALASR